MKRTILFLAVMLGMTGIVTRASAELPVPNAEECEALRRASYSERNFLTAATLEATVPELAKPWRKVYGSYAAARHVCWVAEVKRIYGSGS